MPPTCFGHSCGHPQEGALQRIYYTLLSVVMQLSEDGHRSSRKISYVYKTLLNVYMHLLFSLHLTSLMCGHGLLKTV
jgi:hypothetical protein